MSQDTPRPLLSDEEIYKPSVSVEPWPTGGGFSTRIGPGAPPLTATQVRDFYENLIASGELRVQKSVKVSGRGGPTSNLVYCEGCGGSMFRRGVYDGLIKFCPGCGAMIVE